MSVLKNIKGTIQSVQQDLSSSIKSLTISSKDLHGKGIGSKHRLSRVEGVNLDAGADLLNRYQENWCELHQQAEENANKAENLAILIGSLFVKCDCESENFSSLSTECQTLPTVIQRLQDLTNQIARVEELCEQVEAAEVHLENICEVEEFRRAQLTHHQQLAAYRDRKQAAAEKHKVNIALEHAKKVKSQDSKRQAQLRERQSIFQEAFDKDLNYYKTFGKTERQQCEENDTASIDLGDIAVDEDQSALDNFLASTDVTPSSDQPQVLTEDEMPDEEDSGGFYDGNDSPERLPQNISTENETEEENTRGTSSVPDSKSELTPGINSNPANDKGDNSNGTIEAKANDAGSVSAKGDNSEETSDINSEDSDESKDNSSKIVQQIVEDENSANNNSEISAKLESSVDGLKAEGDANEETTVENVEVLKNDAESEAVETGDLKTKKKESEKGS